MAESNKRDNNVMLDLETMDNTSDSAIVSIGACVFSSSNGITSKFEIDVTSSPLLTMEAQ